MKKIKHLALAFTLALVCASCGKKADGGQASADDALQSGENGQEVVDEAEPAAVTTPIETSISGSIDPKEWTPGEEATVSISHFPNTLAEFENLQEQIGDTPQGAVMLQLAAFELYNRDTKAGEEAIKLCNTEINVPSVMRIIPDKFGKTKYNDQHTPFLVATYLDGATPENGYNPTKPYTIQVRSSKVHKYERSEILKGYVLSLEVYSSGYDTHWRGCEVIKQKGNPYFVVNNSPAMYMGCKDIDWESDAEYQGLD